MPQQVQKLPPIKDIPRPVQIQLNGLFVAAQSMEPNDPTRGLIKTQLNKIAKDHNIPINFDDYLGTDNCGTPKIKVIDHINPYELRWKPEHMPYALSKMGICTDVTEKDALEACQKENYGEAVMWAEPEIGALCRAQEVNTPDDQYDDALRECARRKFDNAWALR